ncbi:MAG: hypothetical protein LBE12_09910 [Planctomycetaceae bacterium]|nr:hypothetical protein [Planctomycetaceae bacterium]
MPQADYYLNGKIIPHATLFTVIVYFGPQIYADLRRFSSSDFRRYSIFAEIRYSWIFKDYFLRVRNNETNKGRIDKK